MKNKLRKIFIPSITTDDNSGIVYPIDFMFTPQSESISINNRILKVLT